MNVNFNNLRKKSLLTYDRLAKRMNENIFKESGRLIIDTSEIQEDMDDLRMMLCTIASIHEPDDENFKDITKDINPIEWFNDEEANNEQKKPWHSEA